MLDPKYCGKPGQILKNIDGQLQWVTPTEQDLLEEKIINETNRINNQDKVKDPWE